MRNLLAVLCLALTGTGYAATLRNNLMTSTRTTSCATPVPVSTFIPTDAQANAFFSMGAAATGDQARIEFYGPNNNLVQQSKFDPIATAGSYCFWSTLAINGVSLDLGVYTVKGYWNDAQVFAMNFWLQKPGLTLEQKALDFQVLASYYAKRYAPLDWKKQLFNYDPMDLKPWMDKINATKDDLDYFEVLVQYVAALNDSHSEYSLNSTFSASLGFGTDIYYDSTDAPHILIDSITRSYLPAATYPFEIGDELLSIDGESVNDIIKRFLPFISAASTDSAKRVAASYLASRSQQVFPKAHVLPVSSTIEVKRQSGIVEKYSIGWRFGGMPLTRVGSVPNTRLARRNAAAVDDETPPYMQPLMRFRNEKMTGPVAVLGVSSMAPVWTLPADFQQRLGKTGDYFTSGVFNIRGHNIGYLRIPNFTPSSQTSALRQLETEITYLQDNTDGLVIDVMRNPGGYACYGEELLRRLIPDPWQALARKVRPIWDDVVGLQSSLTLARALGADQATVDTIQAQLTELIAAYNSDRGLTNPISLCSFNLDRTPAAVVYRKPAILLIDEFSASAADAFAAQFQDNKRGKLFGKRTNGAGGSVVDEYVGYYTEGGDASVVNSILWRPNAIQTSDYPTANYIENIGVRPDVAWNYMQVDNLMQKGKPFVDAFLNLIADVVEGVQ